MEDRETELAEREAGIVASLKGHPAMLRERIRIGAFTKDVDEARRLAREIGPEREARLLDLVNRGLSDFYEAGGDRRE